MLAFVFVGLWFPLIVNVFPSDLVCNPDLLLSINFPYLDVKLRCVKLNCICCILYPKFNMIDAFNSHQTLDYLVRRHHLLSGKWSWRLPSLYSSRETAIWSQPHINKGKRSAWRTEHLVPIGMPIASWKTRHPNVTNMLSIKNSVIFIMSVS